MSVVGNYAIEEAVYNLFTANDDQFVQVELGQFPFGLNPGLNVAVLRGRFSRSDMGSYRQQIDIVLLIVARNIRSERERRRIIHPLVEYVVRKLVGTDLGLDIEEIEPQGWDEKTTIKNFLEGEVVFEARFSTASSIPSSPVNEEDELFMTEILSEYALLQNPKQVQPPDPENPTAPPLEQPAPTFTSTVVFATDEGNP